MKTATIAKKALIFGSSLLVASTMFLVGAVHVKEGATLTIPAGTMIKADLTGTVAYLLIEKGAKIMAEGTVDKPIVFTSSAAIPRRRDWGGIIINGKAPINVTGGEAATEISPEIKYGGTVADDNSGKILVVSSNENEDNNEQT